MGLLDILGALDGNAWLGASAGLLGQQPSRAPISMGNSLAAGYGGYQAAKAAELERKMKEQEMLARVQQMAMQKLQIDEVKQKMADATGARNFNFGQYYQSPQQQAIGQGGPTDANAAMIPQLAPRLDTKGMLGGMMASGNPNLIQQALPMLTKDDTPLIVPKGGMLSTREGRQLAINPDTPDIKDGYLVPDGKGGWRPDPALFELQRQLKATSAPRTTVNVPVNVSTEKKYGEQFAGKIADQDALLLDAAQKAPDLADRSNRIKEVLASGKVITGIGADYRLQFGKALGVMGANDQETIVNTESLSADLARNTLDAIKSSGLGSGSGFSNADRDFLNKAAGGLITFNSGTISRLADLSHRVASKTAESWNKRVKNIPQSAVEGTGINTNPVQVPPLFSAGIPLPPNPSAKNLTVGQVYSTPMGMGEWNGMQFIRK